MKEYIIAANILMLSWSSRSNGKQLSLRYYLSMDAHSSSLILWWYNKLTVQGLWSRHSENSMWTATGRLYETTAITAVWHGNKQTESCRQKCHDIKPKLLCTGLVFSGRVDEWWKSSSLKRGFVKLTTVLRNRLSSFCQQWFSTTFTWLKVTHTHTSP